jgi:hypothetical protein
MNQHIFSIRRTPGGDHYCVAYTASGNRPVAVSRKTCHNGNEALNDVLEQLGLLTVKPSMPRSIQHVPSAAAGGVR